MNNERKKYEDILKKVIKGIQDTADAMGIHPSEVTIAQFRKHVPDVTPWSLRLVGGLSGVKKHHFPVVGKDLVQIREQKETSRYINELEKQLGERELFEKSVLSSIEKNLKPVSIKPYKPASKKKNKIKRHVVTMLNDIHLGLEVDADEVGGTNKFGWLEGGRRIAAVTEQVVNYKKDKRDQIDVLHLALNGDLLQGVIHDLSAKNADLMVNQVNGGIHILSHVIARYAENYKHVVVHCVTGNHEDFTHRREGGKRVVTHKYDSFSNIMFFALSSVFKNVKNVDFNIPKTPYAMIDLPNGRIMVVHGDGIFNKSLGNPGSSLNISSLSNDVHRFSLGEMKKGNPEIKGLLLGHTHTYVNFITYDGVHVINAPSLSGTDQFAASLGFNNNVIGQILFESTSDFIVGDQRLINVDGADKNEKLDKVIPPFTGELKA